MFVRTKPSGAHRYLQIVENHREGKRVVQRVLCTLGRVDELMASGQTDGLIRSLARFGDKVRVVEEYEKGNIEAKGVWQIGPDLAFGHLWKSCGIAQGTKGAFERA